MPDWDRSVVRRVAGGLRLALDARRRLGAGTRLGAGAGSSQEFHDHRAYQPGDDLRHLDWGVLARTDQLLLRRHRQESSPRLELLVDASASQAAFPAKWERTLHVTDLLATLAEAEGLRPVVWWMDAHPRALGREWRTTLVAAQPGGTAGLDQRLPLTSGSDRVLISDGLCPRGAEAVLRLHGAAAGRLALVEVLTSAERLPTTRGPRRLEDVEGGFADHHLDARTLAAYADRLARHRAGWAAGLAGRGPGVAALTAEDPWPDAIAILARQGFVVPRG